MTSAHRAESQTTNASTTHVRLNLSIDGADYDIDLGAPFDLAIPVDFDGAQPHAFGLPRAEARAVDAGGFVGDTRRGGSCNCETITINPHGSGTHTECAGHVTRERITIADVGRDAFAPCTVISVTPELATHGSSVDSAHVDDRVISRASIEHALVALGERSQDLLRALVIRTLPNNASKKSAEYTGT
ncbi:MAG: cyclase family protein, partial [bacterium]|nr:cyclase family protein [Candidatus Kapabacteria bacterium]